MPIMAIIVSGSGYLLALLLFLVLTALADGSLRFDFAQSLKEIYARIQRLGV
jgi:hypothetical protein